MEPGSQEQTIAFLTSPASYSLDGAVHRIETHISIVFLAGDRAYKLKKALRLPYLDFSTPSTREAACRKELALNARTAPELYLAVRRITSGPQGTLEFDGQGPLVDAVVEMKRFEQDLLFDHLAEAGRLTPELMTEAARRIASFHRTAAISAESGADNIAAVLDINSAGFATSQVFRPDAIARLQERFRAALRCHSDVLERRSSSEGRIRRCHGDLHLRNICLLDGPTLFDCIEFNDRIATIDVLYDLSFLLMDMWHRNLRYLANLTMNRYLDASQDEGGFPLLPFFMALRAAVRAHVVATQADEPGQRRDALASEAKTYFALAEDLLQERPNRLIAIGGFSGSGKSTVADQVAGDVGTPPGARVLESDRIRKQIHGVDAEVRLPGTAYGVAQSERVYVEMARRARAILTSGGSVVANAVFSDPAHRALITAAAGYAPFRGVWLEATTKLLEKRVKGRRGGASDADLGVLARQVAEGAGEIAWLKIDASLPPQVIAERLAAERTSSEDPVADESRA